jgi:hypothetical protein
MLQWIQEDKDLKMLYIVEAKFHDDLLSEFFTNLTNDTIKEQKPNGLEIVNSMKIAKIKDDNSLVWYENCFCATPLKHERETVYDNYLYDFKTTLVDKKEDNIIGKFFWEYMESKVGK